MYRYNLKNIVSRILAIILAFAILGTGAVKVYATGIDPIDVAQQESETQETIVQGDPFVVVEYYEVTNEKIVPGENFTLKIVLKNYDMKNAATGVLLDITNPFGVAPVYGTVSQLYIGDIGAGESKEITLDYNSWTTVTSDTLDFNVTIISASNVNYVVLRIPVGSDSPFSILNVTIPNEIKVNDLATVFLTFKVLGEDRIKDVLLKAVSNDLVMGTSQIGILAPGITKTQQLLLSFNDLGEHAIDLCLEYVDETGQKKSDTIATSIIEVVTNVPDDIDTPVPGTDVADDSKDTILLMGVSGMLILLVFLVVIIVLRKKK